MYIKTLYIVDSEEEGECEKNLEEKDEPADDLSQENKVRKRSRSRSLKRKAPKQGR